MATKTFRITLADKGSRTTKRTEKADPLRTGAVLVTGKAKEWASRRPDTRVPAMVLALLYPFGEFAYGYLRADWLWLVLFAPVVAGPVWLAAHRAHGDCRYTRIVTASAAAVPLWLAVAARVGIFRMPVLLGYTSGAVALWWAYAQSEVLTERQANSSRQSDWGEFARGVGLAGSGIREVTPTRLGEMYKVDIRGTSRTAGQWARSDLAENWAAALSQPKSRVRVNEDPKHAGQIVVEIRTRDPWRESNAHPALNPGSEWKLPAARSIHDGPVEVGADPTSGDMLSLALYGRGGARHVMIVAATEGGKTTLANCAIERVTACDDALIWPIDIVKGTLPSVWAAVADWAAGVGDATGAMRILRGAKTTIEMRSEASGGRNHVASPTAPCILIPFDEAAKLLNHPNARLAADARDLIGFIADAGRSAAVGFVYIAQRGAIQYAGTMSIKANAHIRVALGVTQSSEMLHIVPDWQEIGAPDMSKYGESRPGVALVVTEGRWMAGRVWDLSDLDAVEELAKRRGAPTARLEPAIAAKLGEPYANRRAPAKVMAAVPVAQQPEEEYVGDPDIDRQFSPIARSIGEIEEAAEDIAGMQRPEAEWLPMQDLIKARAEEEAANRAAKVPDEILVPMLAIYNAAGPEGYSRAELVDIFAELGVSESKLKRWLRVMVDQGTLARRGATSNARYVLPEHAGNEGADE